ncbi:hypothetical protein [Leifsonia poae]|uniref:hypothetical protein n=1 Tax=Leifsonia poae TaxID=110933 RepID=UPI003D66E873
MTPPSLLVSSSCALTFAIAAFHAASLGADAAWRMDSERAASATPSLPPLNGRTALLVASRVFAFVFVPEMRVVVKPAATSGPRSAERTVPSPGHAMPCIV